MFRKEQGNHCKQKEFTTYFPTATLQYKVMQPMSMTENATNFDVKYLWRWFNWTSRSCKNGIARVMCEVNPENRLILKPEGLLTRDPRMVERRNSVRRSS
jgi:small subunit ribosomal protein S9